MLQKIVAVGIIGGGVGGNCLRAAEGRDNWADSHSLMAHIDCTTTFCGVVDLESKMSLFLVESKMSLFLVVHREVGSSEGTSFGMQRQKL